MTKCEHCKHYRVFPKIRCNICIAITSINWEYQSILDDCEYFESTEKVVETSEYRASHYQPPKEFHINQTTFGSE